MKDVKENDGVPGEVFDDAYLKEFEEFSSGVRGIRERFILATGDVEKGIDEVISIVLFGRDRNRMNLFKDTIINREFFTIENKFEILTEIISRGEIEFEKNERDSFLNQINEVIRMKRLFLKGDIVLGESSVRIYSVEKKIKVGRILDEEFFNEINDLVSGAVSLLKELGEFIEDSEGADLEEGEVELDEALEDVDDEELGADIEEEDEEDGFKVEEKDIWKEETGMMDDYTKDTALDEMADITQDVEED